LAFLGFMSHLCCTELICSSPQLIGRCVKLGVIVAAGEQVPIDVHRNRNGLVPE